MAEPLIRLEGVSKRFGGIVALDELSLEVPEGSVCGLLGPNGSGKTTAIRILLGLTRASGGSATLLGAAPHGPGFATAIHQTGALVEGPALYGRATARRNMEIQAVARGIRDPGSQIDELLSLVKLNDRADTKARGFSLGMKQRLGLAIALIGSPRLVILDEPTNGLDPSGIVEIRELIKQLPERGITVLVSSHLLSEVQLMCDRATIIKSGKLVADGTMEQILDGAGPAGWRVYVRMSEEAQARDALIAAGMTATGDGQGCLSARGQIEDDSEITRILAGQGIYLRGLMRERADLERVFMALTGGESGDAK